MLEGASADIDWRRNGRNGHGRYGIVGKFKEINCRDVEVDCDDDLDPRIFGTSLGPSPAVKIARMLLMELVDLDWCFGS